MFRSIIQNNPFGVWVLDESGVVVFCNKSAEDMLPLDRPNGVGSHISTSLPGLSIKDGALLVETRDSGEFENVISLPSPQGEWRYYEISSSQFMEGADQTRHIINLHEVTSRIEAWQALKDQEKRWNLALEGSQIGVFESDLRTGQGVASDAWYHLLGICDATGRNSDDEWRARIHPEDRAAVEAIDADCIEGRIEKSEAKFRMRVRDGAWRWMRSILRVTERDAQGRAVRLLGTMIDITSLESALELAKARKDGLEILMTHAPVAMAVIARDGRFLLFNNNCHTLLGYPPGVLEKHKFWALSGFQGIHDLQEKVERLVEEHATTTRLEAQYAKPDGEVVDIVIRLSIVRRSDLEETRLIVQLTDVTEQKRLEALKNNFVATVSHELRTPLASVHGGLRLLTKAIGDDASAQVYKLLDLAGRNSTRLTQVVDDLLDFQKLTAGHFAVELEQVESVELVRQSILDIAAFAEKFAVPVALEACAPSAYITADMKRFKQVITNLLSNAVKFSAADGVVQVKVEAKDGHCTISVSNNGPGISAEFGARIFQPFSQQADHLTRSREGTGLGLAISKELVENMGGEIGYRSVPDRLTTFWVQFPLQTQATQMANPSALHLVKD